MLIKFMEDISATLKAIERIANRLRNDRFKIFSRAIWKRSLNGKTTKVFFI